MPTLLRHLRHRPALLTGLLLAVAAALLAAVRLQPMTALLAGWDVGVLGYGLVLVGPVRRSTVAELTRLSAVLDEGRWGMLTGTVAAAVISLGAIVLELAQTHGKPDAAWAQALAGATVLLSWFFVHAIFATHYAHVFWRDGSGLVFPGNPQPAFDEFLYFSFCIAVASQVSDVPTQSAGMRRLVLAHSLVAYLFNAAVIALGVNIAASLAG